MRLIDADTLYEHLDKRRTYEVMDGRNKAYGKGVRDAMKDLASALTVPAIPVEWLRRYTAVGVAPIGNRLTEGNERLIVHRILNEWQQEQEGR